MITKRQTRVGSQHAVRSRTRALPPCYSRRMLQAADGVGEATVLQGLRPRTRLKFPNEFPEGLIIGGGSSK